MPDHNVRGARRLGQAPGRPRRLRREGREAGLEAQKAREAKSAEEARQPNARSLFVALDGLASSQDAHGGQGG